MSAIKFGCDPEIFAGYFSDGGLMVLPPAWLREHGAEVVLDPEKPTHPKFIETKDYIVHEDGVALELGVEPSYDWTELFARVQDAYKNIEENLLSGYMEDCDGKVHIVPTIGFEVDRWKAASPEFQQCLIFGCDPDEDAFNSKAKARVQSVAEHPFRYGGGHVHFSGSPLFEVEPILAVKCLALTLGQAAIAFSDVPELENKRTYLYGRPGKYRVQHYSNGEVGIEYRTPSNRWTSDFNFAKEIFEWSRKGIFLLESGLGAELLPELEVVAAQNIIETNQKSAFQVLNRISERI